MMTRETISQMVMRETRVLMLLGENRERKQHLLCSYLINFEDLGQVTEIL